MRIGYHKEFIKNYKKLPLKIQEQFKQRQILFEKDKFDPVLNNHSLTGKYQGYRSINVSGNIRAIFKVNGDSVIFIKINSHSNLYR